MGSQSIHYEALRKQLVMDRRSSMNIQKKFHIPPYQPYYVPYELPKDDMYVPKENIIEAKPTIHSFTHLDLNQPWKFLSQKDIHGNSSASYRKDPRESYSAKIRNRYNNADYLSQW